MAVPKLVPLVIGQLYLLDIGYFNRANQFILLFSMYTNLRRSIIGGYSASVVFCTLESVAMALDTVDRLQTGGPLANKKVRGIYSSLLSFLFLFFDSQFKRHLLAMNLRTHN
jgi:hypothetical protein